MAVLKHKMINIEVARNDDGEVLVSVSKEDNGEPTRDLLRTREAFLALLEAGREFVDLGFAIQVVIHPAPSSIIEADKEV